jgi:hypothetical protein
MLSWVHFGDLHASNDDNYESLDHLRSMIRSVNRHLSDRVDFAFLPGDNANNGTPEQFQRIFEHPFDAGWPLTGEPARIPSHARQRAIRTNPSSITRRSAPTRTRSNPGRSTAFPARR